MAVKLKLEWRPRATEDLFAIVAYIAEDSAAAAQAIKDDIEAHAMRAQARPTLYKPGRMEGTRELVVQPSYVIVFRMEAGSVVALRVLHTAQQWPPSDKK
jgi:toxin ParE1/3/4